MHQPLARNSGRGNVTASCRGVKIDRDAFLEELLLSCAQLIPRHRLIRRRFGASIFGLGICIRQEIMDSVGALLLRPLGLLCFFQFGVKRGVHFPTHRSLHQ